MIKIQKNNSLMKIQKLNEDKKLADFYKNISGNNFNQNTYDKYLKKSQASSEDKLQNLKNYYNKNLSLAGKNSEELKQGLNDYLDTLHSLTPEEQRLYLTKSTQRGAPVISNRDPKNITDLKSLKSAQQSLNDWMSNNNLTKANQQNANMKSYDTNIINNVRQLENEYNKAVDNTGKSGLGKGINKLLGKNSKKDVIVNFVKNNLNLNGAAEFLNNIRDGLISRWVPRMRFASFTSDNPFLNALDKVSKINTNDINNESIFYSLYNAYVNNNNFNNDYLNRNHTIITNPNLYRLSGVEGNKFSDRLNTIVRVINSDIREKREGTDWELFVKRVNNNQPDMLISNSDKYSTKVNSTDGDIRLSRKQVQSILQKANLSNNQINAIVDALAKLSKR